MKLARWILFLPGGLACGLIVAFIVLLIATYTIGEGSVAWFALGLLSSAGFFWAAFTIAPLINKWTKWTALTLQSIIGIMYVSGPLLTGEDSAPMSAGFAMLLMAVTLSRVPVSQFAKNKSDV
jgi:hypothetical protein